MTAQLKMPKEMAAKLKMPKFLRRQKAAEDKQEASTSEEHSESLAWEEGMFMSPICPMNGSHSISSYADSK